MEDIFEHLRLNRYLDGLNLKKKSGKWDLTNLSIPKPKTVDKFDYKNYSIRIPDKIFKFKDVLLHNVDLSFSNLDYSIWENCTFNNVLLKETSGKKIKLIACVFKNALFENANLMDSLIGGQKESDSGHFNNIKFIKTNLKRTYYTFPKFENCKFIDCDLKEVDFDGSRFFNSSFEGKLDSVFFRGYPQHLQKDTLSDFSQMGIFNPMQNVDFTKAEMFGVTFSNQIDLSHCIFPTSDNYLFIKHFPATYEIARETVLLKWKDKDKELALDLLNNVYLSKANLKNKNDFIDKEVIDKMIKVNGFVDKLFSLLRSIEENYFNQ